LDRDEEAGLEAVMRRRVWIALQMKAALAITERAAAWP